MRGKEIAFRDVRCGDVLYVNGSRCVVHGKHSDMLWLFDEVDDPFDLSHEDVPFHIWADEPTVDEIEDRIEAYEGLVSRGLAVESQKDLLLFLRRLRDVEKLLERHINIKHIEDTKC